MRATTPPAACSAATACEITRCGVSASTGAAAKASRTIIRRLFESSESLQSESRPVGSPFDITFSVCHVAQSTCQPPTWPLLGKPGSPCSSLARTPDAVSASAKSGATAEGCVGTTQYKALAEGRCGATVLLAPRTPLGEFAPARPCPAPQWRSWGNRGTYGSGP